MDQPLFSGDAGSAESNIRKWMLDSDIVEAVIQLPTDEFFNTGIYTYLWVLNKNKQPQHQDKVMLINASEKFMPLKISKGSKRAITLFINVSQSYGLFIKIEKLFLTYFGVIIILIGGECGKYI
jgi:type I restriction-modification system DNA methylase subunit